MRDPHEFNKPSEHLRKQLFIRVCAVDDICNWMNSLLTKKINFLDCMLKMPTTSLVDEVGFVTAGSAWMD
jgi:hypothetical protein